MTLSTELKEKIKARGASVVAYADLSGLDETSRRGYQYGILIGIALNPVIITNIKDGPTGEYYGEYNRVNQKLNELGEYAQSLLEEKGFSALAKTTKLAVMDESLQTELPHKTVATRAGVGWIGKCALLITKEFGAAIRLTSVLTDAELETETPVNTSHCGKCTVCKEICPAGAVSGHNWNAGKKRGEFFNAFACRKTARERSGRIGIDESLCGLCILKCPFTQRYLRTQLKA